MAPERHLDEGRVRAWVVVSSVEDALWNLSIGGSDAAWDVRCARTLARV